VEVVFDEALTAAAKGVAVGWSTTWVNAVFAAHALTNDVPSSIFADNILKTNDNYHFNKFFWGS
jgi:hypothetical protein